MTRRACAPWLPVIAALALTCCGGSTGSGSTATSSSGSAAGSNAGATGSGGSATGGASSGGSTNGGTSGGSSSEAGGTSGGTSGDDAGTTCSSTPGTCTPCPGTPGNAIFVGKYCTKGGGQCPFLQAACAADEPGGAGQDYCVVIDCPTFSDGGYNCGANACCYGETGNPIHACVPFECATVDGVTCPPPP